MAVEARRRLRVQRSVEVLRPHAARHPTPPYPPSLPAQRQHKSAITTARIMTSPITTTTNDRSRPTARRTSSGRARGSRASNKPCPRASLLHRVPNKRNRVDARAFGREWFLENWSSKRDAGACKAKACEKPGGRSFHMPSLYRHQHLTHRFSPGSKLFFGTVPSAGSPAGSCRTPPTTWSTPRRGACSMPRDHPTPAPDSPARRQAAEVKMVGYIRIAHGIAQRQSEKWRHCACALFSSLFCTSPFCVG